MQAETRSPRRPKPTRCAASHVERARHRADLARRRYLAVDPDNRLVADSLEADWNDALRALQAAQDDYDNASAAAAATLTDEHKARIRALATDFPALWSNPATPQRERKRMVRLLIDDVTLDKTDHIHLHVRFRGGQTTSLTVPIPPQGLAAPPDPPRHPRRTRPAPRRATPTPRPPTRSTPPVTAPAKASRSPPGSCSHLRRSTPPAQPRRPAPRPRPAHHHRDSPHASACTPAPSRPGTAPDCSTSHKANDKNDPALRTTRPRRPPPHRPTRQAPSENEFPPNPHQEVQYETPSLVRALVGCQNCVIGLDLAIHAARSYSLMRPPRTARRWIRSFVRSATAWSGLGGRS